MIIGTVICLFLLIIEMSDISVFKRPNETLNELTKHKSSRYVHPAIPHKLVPIELPEEIEEYDYILDKKKELGSVERLIKTDEREDLDKLESLLQSRRNLLDYLKKYIPLKEKNMWSYFKQQKNILEEYNWEKYMTSSYWSLLLIPLFIRTILRRKYKDSITPRKQDECMNCKNLKHNIFSFLVNSDYETEFNIPKIPLCIPIKYIPSPEEVKNKKLELGMKAYPISLTSSGGITHHYFEE